MSLNIINQFKNFSLEYEFDPGKIKYKRKSWKQIWYMIILQKLFPNDFTFNPGGSDYV